MSNYASAVDVAIASGATTSGAFPTGRCKDQVVIEFPSAFTGATVSFSGATAEGGTYQQIVDDSGTAISITATVSKNVYVNEAESRALLANRWLKIVSAGSEAAARTLTVSMK